MRFAAGSKAMDGSASSPPNSSKSSTTKSPPPPPLSSPIPPPFMPRIPPAPMLLRLFPANGVPGVRGDMGSKELPFQSSKT